MVELKPLLTCQNALNSSEMRSPALYTPSSIHRWYVAVLESVHIWKCVELHCSFYRYPTPQVGAENGWNQGNGYTVHSSWLHYLQPAHSKTPPRSSYISTRSDTSIQWRSFQRTAFHKTILLCWIWWTSFLRWRSTRSTRQPQFAPAKRTCTPWATPPSFVAPWPPVWQLSCFQRDLKDTSKEAITLKPSLTPQKVDENIEAMATAMRSSGMLASVETNRGLANFFTNTHATPEQRHDLLQYRKIGQADYDAHVNYCLLNSPSSKAPTRQRKLSTSATSTIRSKREKKFKSDTWSLTCTVSKTS